jgi:orotidine-5'-phosphate decarboxylase
VLALDLEEDDPQRLQEKSVKILDDVRGSICALKINRQLVISLGLREVSSILHRAREYSLPTIMDAKLNDVGHTNAFMMRAFLQAGFDAVIASPVTGWEGGMDSVFSLAREHGKGVILLVYMSNPGAEQFYSTVIKGPTPRPIFEHFAELSMQWGAEAIVVGATRPEIVRRVRKIVGPKMIILSPGIGAQGGDARKAIEAGATYLIVGRSIYASPSPSQAAQAINHAVKSI